MTWIRLDEIADIRAQLAVYCEELCRRDAHLDQFRAAGIVVREFGDWQLGYAYAIYRLLDEAGRLLYVGITRSSVRTRIQESHRHRQWWAEVARIEVTYGYTRAEALK